MDWIETANERDTPPMVDLRNRPRQRCRCRPLRPAAGAGGFGAGASFSDIFGDVFGDIFGGGGGGGRGGKRVYRGADLRYNLELSLEDAVRGTTVKIRVPTYVSCKTCDGSGAKKGTKPSTCTTCGGQSVTRTCFLLTTVAPCDIMLMSINPQEHAACVALPRD